MPLRSLICVAPFVPGADTWETKFIAFSGIWPFAERARDSCWSVLFCVDGCLGGECPPPLS